jgi:hypothetical protein
MLIQCGGKMTCNLRRTSAAVPIRLRRSAVVELGLATIGRGLWRKQGMNLTRVVLAL